MPMGVNIGFVAVALLLLSGPLRLITPLNGFSIVKDVFRMAIEEDGVNNPSPAPGSSEQPVAFAFAKHFQNEMVLQREPQRANIYGFSPDVGTKLVMMVRDSAHLSSDYYETVVKQGSEPGLGTWMFTLKPMAAGTTVSIRVEGYLGVLTLSDVIFGDVWICSGQSNMAFTVNMMIRAKEELEEASNHPNIRVFTAAEQVSKTPLNDLISVLEPWSKASNESLGGTPWGKAWSDFSAVCWMFGKNIHKALGIPIGLVDTNWGGTPVEAWSSPDALKKCNITAQQGKQEHYEHLPYSEIPLSMKQAGTGGPPGDNSVLWNAMVHPLLAMTIYGAVWYQGESDSSHPRVEHYNCTFPTMIDDWRDKFHAASNGETSNLFPFGFVQLASNVPNPGISFGLPDIRWHQTADYGYVPNPRMQNVFMAVAMDLPGFTSAYGSIHPQDKTDVGYRLALSGLQYAYNMTQVCQGPFPATAVISGSEIVIVYGNVDRLEIRDWAGFELLCVANTASPDSTQTWTPTRLISNSSTTVSLYLNVCPQGQKVGGMRYAWKESPCAFKKCAVYRSVNGLPAPQFVAFVENDANGKATFKFDGPTTI